MILSNTWEGGAFQQGPTQRDDARDLDWKQSRCNA